MIDTTTIYGGQSLLVIVMIRGMNDCTAMQRSARGCYCCSEEEVWIWGPEKCEGRERGLAVMVMAPVAVGIVPPCFAKARWPVYVCGVFNASMGSSTYEDDDWQTGTYSRSE